VTESSPPRRTAPLTRRTLWTIVVVGAVGVALGVWLVITLLPRLWSGEGPPAPTSTGGATTDERRIQATLYYGTSDGEALVGVTRSVAFGATPVEQARRILDAQIQPPPDGLVSVIPPGTTVRHVFITPTGEAYVDFGPEIVKAHPGGSLGEALTVFAFVNALTVNLPDVKAVQLLVDGREVDTLVGHVDLRQPLQKSLKWVRAK
jgi:hypothetical protein